MDKELKIYTEKDDGTRVNFPDEQSETTLSIVDFSYTGSRMEIPSLSASVKYQRCLDSDWNYSQFVEFRGEKYWVSKIPSSSKDNTDHRYKHDISFYSERSVLQNIYFYDIVDATMEEGAYHSNSANVLFYGTLDEFVSRMNHSLQYSGIDYTIHIDDDAPSTESKEFSCENTFVFDALKQAFETWDIPFYFKGKECHFGYYSINLGKDEWSSDGLDLTPLEYGRDNGLLKIERTNANTRIITRATGVGGSENIPFYYPNDSEKGNFTFETNIPKEYEIIDKNKLACSVVGGVTYKYTGETIESISTQGDVFFLTPEGKEEYLMDWNDDGDELLIDGSSYVYDCAIVFEIANYNANVNLLFNINTSDGSNVSLSKVQSIELQQIQSGKYQTLKSWMGGINSTNITTDIEGGIPIGEYRFYLRNINFKDIYEFVGDTYIRGRDGDVSVNIVGDKTIEATSQNWWIPTNGDYKKIKSLRDIGIDYEENPPHLITYAKDEGYTGEDLGKTFTLTFKEDEKFVYQDRLMPSIFSRGTAFGGNVTVANKGVERYYNAKNGLYGDITFDNELNRFNRSENIYTYDDIKPRIENVENSNGELICEIVDVQYDTNDDDSTLGEEYGENSDNYAHPYFYIRIAQTDCSTMDGGLNDFSFNLFNRATEKDSMTIQMTSGDCNGCKFKVQVVDKGNNNFKNPVQVDSEGDIVNGDKSEKVSLSNFIENQQDTRKNSVWLALLKDVDTFGIIMPNQEGKHYVKIGDTFNITGIHLPDAYIIAAEQELDERIIMDMSNENIESFNHSIDLSRIFLQEDYEANGDNSWAKMLNETVKVPIKYNGTTITQYVTSYTYECKGAELLPKISLQLANTIAKSESYSDAIVKKSTKQASQQTTRAIWGASKSSFATKSSVDTKAVKSNTLQGYGIGDARIEQDGTIVLGNSSIKPLTEADSASSVNWKQVTNTPNTIEGYGIEDAVDTHSEQIIYGEKSFVSNTRFDEDVSIDGSLGCQADARIDGTTIVGELVIGLPHLNKAVRLYYDEDNDCLRIDKGVASDGFISAMGLDDTNV